MFLLFQKYRLNSFFRRVRSSLKEKCACCFLSHILDRRKKAGMFAFGFA
jgi:hypothetical protein